jgi:hypothetical protein
MRKAGTPETSVQWARDRADGRELVWEQEAQPIALDHDEWSMYMTNAFTPLPLLSSPSTRPEPSGLQVSEGSSVSGPSPSIANEERTAKKAVEWAHEASPMDEAEAVPAHDERALHMSITPIPLQTLLPAAPLLNHIAAASEVPLLNIQTPVNVVVRDATTVDQQEKWCAPAQVVDPPSVLRLYREEARIKLSKSITHFKVACKIKQGLRRTHLCSACAHHHYKPLVCLCWLRWPL